MNQFLGRLLEPTPTLPIPRGRLFGDKRPWRKQVASGLRIAAGLIAGFCVIVLAGAGLLPWSGPPHQDAPVRFLVGWWTLPVAVLIMVLTAHRWAPFTIAFFLGPVLLRAFVHLVVGPSPTSPILWQTMPRVEAAQLFAYCAVVIGLTWRFVRERPAPTTFLDRCALTFFAIATLEQAFVTYRVPPLPLLSGVMALFIAWVAYHLNRATKRHEHHPHRIGSLDTRS
jgi:hypothetical protein